MEFKRSGPSLTDLELDREIAAALAVEPSADFLARVRHRVAAEREPLSTRPWMFAAAAVAVAAIVSVVAFSQGRLTAGPPAAGAPAPLAGERRAGEKPTSEMRAVMHANEDATAAARIHLEDRNYEALVGDAAKYTQNFAYLEGFWASRRVDEALALSRRGLEAAAQLRAAALAGDQAAVAAALAIIFGTCEACHKRFREEVANDTYVIKL
jgi:cytochrome c'